MLWPTPIHVVTATVCAVPVCSVVTDTDIRSDSSNMGSIWGIVQVAVWDEWVNSVTLMDGIPGIWSFGSLKNECNAIYEIWKRLKTDHSPKTDYKKWHDSKEKPPFFIQQKNFERARNRLRLSSLSALNQVRCSLPHRSSCFWCQSLWFSLRSKLNNRAYARMEKMRPWRTRHPKASSRIRANGKDGLVGCAKSSYPKSVLPAFSDAPISEILHCWCLGMEHLWKPKIIGSYTKHPKSRTQHCTQTMLSSWFPLDCVKFSLFKQCYFSEILFFVKNL